MMKERNYLRPEVLAGIGDLELRARYAVEGLVSGMHQSPYSGYSVEFAQHREYAPGDDLRHLDWRVYGRSDRFYIKQYEEETNLQLHLVVDASASMRYPEHAVESGRMTKFDYAATLAASLAYLVTHQQDAAGLLLFDDEIRADLPPQSHQAHLQTMLHRLQQALLERPTGGRSLFTDLAGRLRRRSMVVLISDLLADLLEVIGGLLTMRHSGHEVIVLHVLDHDERVFPFQNNTLFEGLEAPRLQALVDPQSLRSSYLDALAAFTSRLRGACAGSKIDYVELSTTEPLDVGLRRYLAARSHLIKART
jgi:uncharacterized protein (DUF58 family)